MLENLHRTKEIGLESRELLEAGDLDRYAELMHEHWQNKRVRSAAWPPTASTSSTRSRAQRAARRQARRRRRRRLPARLRAEPGRHAHGDAARRRARARFDFEFQGCSDRVPVSVEPLRVGIVGCGLIGRKRAEALGGDRLVGVLRRRRRRRRRAGRADGARACPSLDALLALGPRRGRRGDAPTILSPPRLPRAGAAPTCWSRSPRGSARPRSSAIAARPRRRGGSSRSASTTASTRRSRGRSPRSHSGAPRRRACSCARRYGHGGRLGYEREWRAEPGARAAASSIDQGMHLLDLATGCSGRCRCTRRCCARATGTRRSRTTRR